MTEPSRLIEVCADPLERAILQSGYGITASPEGRARTLELLGLSTPARPQVLAFLPRRRTRLVLAAVAFTGLAAAVPFAYFVMRSGVAEPAASVRPSSSQPLDASARQGLSAAARPETPSSRVPVQPAPQNVEASAEESKRQANPSVESTSSLSTNSRSVVEPNRLTAELRALDAARSRLHSGDPKGALRLLDAYEREFQQPRLALEAEVVRIFAYDKAGQKDTARRRASAFVAKYPKGVLTARVRRYLEP